MHPSQTQNNYVPVIGTSYFWPLAALLEKLDSMERKRANEVQTSNAENGYSVAVVAIAVFILESAIGRAQYLKDIVPPLNTLDFVRENYPNLHDDIEELFVLRDVIVHNHLWDASVEQDANGELCIISAQLRERYGDKKFQRVVDQSIRMTRRLGLNAFPTRIWWNDVVIALQKMLDLLEALDAGDQRIFSLAAQPIRYRNEAVMFVDLVRSLQKVEDSAG